jgi:hypothetical protein
MVYTNENGWTTEIPYTASAHSIKSGIERITDIYDIEPYTSGRSWDGYKIGLFFRGLEGDRPDL